MTKPHSEAEGHLLLWKKRRGAILGILLKLEGLLGPAHCLQMHPHFHFGDMSFKSRGYICTLVATQISCPSAASRGKPHDVNMERS